MIAPSLHDQICDRLNAIRPGATWAMRGETYEGLEWLDPVQTKPTPEELGL